MKTRIAASGLALLASAMVMIAGYESYTGRAVIPVPGDVPTKGYGTTTNPDGSAVKMGDTTTPTRALVDLLRDASDAERAVKRCAPVPMHLHEFSAFVSLTYNIGSGAFCKSSLVRKLNAGDYAGACLEILRWDRFRGKPLAGLTKRREAEYRMCIGDAVGTNLDRD